MQAVWYDHLISRVLESSSQWVFALSFNCVALAAQQPMAEGQALASACEVVEAAEVQAAGLGLQAVPSGCSRINVGSALINWKSDDQAIALIAGFFFAHLVIARKKARQVYSWKVLKFIYCEKATKFEFLDTLNSLINVKSSLLILKNSTLHKKKSTLHVYGFLRFFPPFTSSLLHLCTTFFQKISPSTFFQPPCLQILHFLYPLHVCSNLHSYQRDESTQVDSACYHF